MRVKALNASSSRRIHQVDLQSLPDRGSRALQRRQRNRIVIGVQQAIDFGARRTESRGERGLRELLASHGLAEFPGQDGLDGVLVTLVANTLLLKEVLEAFANRTVMLPLRHLDFLSTVCSPTTAPRRCRYRLVAAKVFSRGRAAGS